MLDRLVPRDEIFFDLFNQIARHVVDAAKLLDRLFAEPARLSEHVVAIKAVEHEADQVTLQVSARLDKSFITPLDREDIHLLAASLDNVVDLLDGTARRAMMFHLTECKEPARRLCGVLVRAADTIETAVEGMKTPAVVNQRVAEIKKLEEEGDAIYQEAVGGLFVGRPDPLDVIKWKEIYDTLESAIDHCQYVGNVLKSISIKNA